MSVVTEHLERQGSAFEVLKPLAMRTGSGDELGALPPLGALLGTKVCVDPEVLRHDTVAFAAGSQTESIKLRTGELFGGERATAVPLVKRPERASDDPIE